jgi:hypothetical protein
MLVIAVSRDVGIEIATREKRMTVFIRFVHDQTVRKDVSLINCVYTLCIPDLQIFFKRPSSFIR